MEQNKFAVAELEKSQAVLAKAKTVVIDTFEQAAGAKKELDDVKELLKTVESERKAKVTPYNAIVDSINAAFKEPKKFLEEAESIIKSALVKFNDKQEALAKLQQAKLEEEARKQREKLEQQAKKAEENGQLEKAEALKSTSENVVVPITQPQPKVEGFSVRKQWKAEVVDKKAFLKAALKNDQMLSLVDIDVSKLNKLAAALQGNLMMDGTKTYQETVAASRSSPKQVNGDNPF